MRHKGFICSEREQHLKNCTQHCSNRGVALSSWLGWIKPSLWKGNPSTFWETQPRTRVQVCSHIVSGWKIGKKGISHLEEQSLAVYEEFIPSSETCPGCMYSIQETVEEDTGQQERNKPDLLTVSSNSTLVECPLLRMILAEAGS